MSAYVIQYGLQPDQLLGTVLVGSSMTLCIHTLTRMAFFRRSGSKYYLFPIINVAQFMNAIAVFFLISYAIGMVSHTTAIWSNTTTHFCFLITKPIILYLAYLRASTVFPAIEKIRPFHITMLYLRVIELSAIFAVSVSGNILCNGSFAPETQCGRLAIVWTIRDFCAPIFRLYYIVCEAIFYYKLFRTLQGMCISKNLSLIRYRRLQTTMFTVDLILLMAVAVYRVIGAINKTLPTHVYYELFSSTFTIFNLSEFGLSIRTLFGLVQEGKNDSNNGTTQNRLEMGAMKPSQRSSCNTRSAHLSDHGVSCYSNSSITKNGDASGLDDDKFISYINPNTATAVAAASPSSSSKNGAPDPSATMAFSNNHPSSSKASLVGNVAQDQFKPLNRYPDQPSPQVSSASTTATLPLASAGANAGYSSEIDLSSTLVSAVINHYYSPSPYLVSQESGSAQGLDPSKTPDSFYDFPDEAYYYDDGCDLGGSSHQNFPHADNDSIIIRADPSRDNNTNHYNHYTNSNANGDSNRNSQALQQGSYQVQNNESGVHRNSVHNSLPNVSRPTRAFTPPERSSGRRRQD
ncbi:hypothetical protein BGW38_002670 [Lunasporangiospora selenospora]|uniref:Uncharacterized protein n=1 Tax=Lunasporangiospora selenospora TaxID=979761 RepID=A0A9P6KD95_9FUNG|nr:hypothetical protein BGW38_002670 [Lunasporangiospora selenospora]